MLKFLTLMPNKNLRCCFLVSHLSTSLWMYVKLSPGLHFSLLVISPLNHLPEPHPDKKLITTTEYLFCLLSLFFFFQLTWRCRFTFTVMPRTGGLRVQAKSTGYRRKFIAELLHVIRDHWPRLSTTVSHCIPVVMLQNVTSLFSFGY